MNKEERGEYEPLSWPGPELVTAVGMGGSWGG